MPSSNVVRYFYDEDIYNHNYGLGNPMRPHRVRLTNKLITEYGLLDKMVIDRPNRRSAE